MNVNIEIEIIFHTEETKQFEELGLDLDISRFNIKKTRFYTIDLITPVNIYQKECTLIYSSGKGFIAPFAQKYIEKLISAYLTHCQ